MAPDEPQTRARRVVEEILRQGDLAVANQLISPTVHHISGGRSVPGLAALRDWTLTLNIFPDSHAIVKERNRRKLAAQPRSSSPGSASPATAPAQIARSARITAWDSR